MESRNFEMPQLIKDVVKGLDNEVRWKIIENLVRNGNMTYTQLRDELDIKHKGSLTFHLGMLSRSAIIDRYENLFDKKSKAYYDISPIGKDVIKGLMESLKPVARPIAFFDEDLIRNSATISSTLKNDEASRTFYNLLPVEAAPTAA